MKRLIRWGLLLVAGLLGGCFQVEDELTLRPDGSGTVRMVVHTAVPAEMEAMMGMSSRSGSGGGMMYPPTSETEARRYFPSKDFTVTVKEESKDDRRTVNIEALFKDINLLLNSEYGRAHQLSLKLEGGVLTLRALGGGEAVARAAEFKAEGEMAGYLDMPGMGDLQKKKGEMKFKFRVALPGTVSDGNGVRDGKSMTWDVERAKCKDGDEFATKLGETLEARCDALGLKFAPVTPPRLGLLPFKDLAAGVAASTAPLPDTNKIAAAARFVPYALHVTRSLDLSGEGGAGQSQAQLTGAVVVPNDLAPQQWGAAKLEEVVDARGKSLKPAEDEDRMMHYSRRFGGMDDGDGDEESEEAGQSRKSNEVRREVALSFVAPDWKVKEIARIKGTVALKYLGGAEVLKISNAVPASLIMDASKRSSFAYTGSDSERGLLSDARLTALGLSLRVQMAMAQGGMMTISLEATGGNTSLVDLQVFDAEGRPWPTILPPSESDGEEHSYQIMVAGRPKPPFSLGLIVSGVGASVDVPILVEKIPVGDK